MSVLIDMAEAGKFPDSVVRLGIRRLLGQRLRDESRGDVQDQGSRYQRLVEELRSSRIALDTQLANDQHYELPAEFFRAVLGKRLKYSSGYWERGASNLDEAEEQMLALYAERGELSDGQRILDLGCGWGSFSLWAAQQFPNADITALSNSSGQREFILSQAEARGLTNVRVITGDINHLQIDDSFDRVVSIEMFEHMRNYALLMNRIESWLNPGGKLLVHIFCHRNLLYPFSSTGHNNWMGRYFFTSGLMPAADTLLYFQDDLRIEQRWMVSGTNYQKTAAAWLANLDSREGEVRELMARSYSDELADTWTERWRMFFMACEELFGYRQGQEWLVCHYRFGRRD